MRIFFAFLHFPSCRRWVRKGSAVHDANPPRSPFFKGGGWNGSPLFKRGARGDLRSLRLHQQHHSGRTGWRVMDLAIVIKGAMLALISGNRHAEYLDLRFTPRTAINATSWNHFFSRLRTLQFVVSLSSKATPVPVRASLACEPISMRVFRNYLR